MPTTTASAPALPATWWPRLSLFEWNDQPWLPSLLWRAETDYLAAAIDLARPFTLLAARIGALCRDAGSDRVVDLCSGGGGPWRHLADEIAAVSGYRPRVTLTDLRPDPAAFARAGADGHAEPVDARAVPAHLSGVRTMFDAFHHFSPVEARAILADAERSRTPIVIAEGVRRSAGNVLAMLLLAPLLTLVLTPRIRPWSGWRLFVTYVVPLVPLLVTWDGVVSCLRAYRPSELRELTAGLDGHGWEIGEIRTRGAVVTYLIGKPRRG